MKNKIAILFYTKSSRALNNGLLPIYLRITVDGVRIEVSISKYVENSIVYFSHLFHKIKLRFLFLTFYEGKVSISIPCFQTLIGDIGLPSPPQAQKFTPATCG